MHDKPVVDVRKTRKHDYWLRSAHAELEKLKTVTKLNSSIDVHLVCFSPIHMSVLLRKPELVHRYSCVLQVLESPVDLANDDKMVRFALRGPSSDGSVATPDRQTDPLPFYIFRDSLFILEADIRSHWTIRVTSIFASFQFLDFFTWGEAGRSMDR